MAHAIPRKAVGSGSQSPEPTATAVAEASPAAIKRKPLDNINLINHRLSGASANGTTTPQSAGFTVRSTEATELRFALGHGGLLAWYDPTCKGKPGPLAQYVMREAKTSCVENVFFLVLQKLYSTISTYRVEACCD